MVLRVSAAECTRGRDVSDEHDCHRKRQHEDADAKQQVIRKSHVFHCAIPVQHARDLTIMPRRETQLLSQARVRHIDQQFQGVKTA
jgi:hypothetical protein